MHLERDAHRTRGVVFVADGRAEERHQGIAGEFLDVSAVPADDAAQRRDYGVDHLEQLFRIEPVGEGGESGNVREQRRDETSLLRDVPAGCDEALGDRAGDEALERFRDVGLCGDLRSGLGRRAAVTTEFRPLGVGAAARGAIPPRHGTSLRVERRKSYPARASVAVTFESRRARSDVSGCARQFQRPGKGVRAPCVECLAEGGPDHRRQRLLGSVEQGRGVLRG